MIERNDPKYIEIAQKVDVSELDRPAEDFANEWKQIALEMMDANHKSAELVVDSDGKPTGIRFTQEMGEPKLRRALDTNPPRRP